jgi:hypothetical protein
MSALSMSALEGEAACLIHGSDVGLAIFNDVITQEAAIHALPVIDLRTIAHSDDDYANSFEPSSKGGRKLAAAIARLVNLHQFDGESLILVQQP